MADVPTEPRPAAAPDRGQDDRGRDDRGPGGRDDRGTGGQDGSPLAAARRVDPLALALAAVSAGAGVIHLVMVPAHAGGSSWLDPVGFAVAGWFQLAVAAVLVLGRGTRPWYAAAAVGNAALVGLWVWSRTVGLPVGEHAGLVEEVGLVDAVCAGLEVAAVGLAVVLAVAPRRERSGLVGPALASVAVLALVTTAVLSPDARQHGHDAASTAAGVGALGDLTATGASGTALSADGHARTHAGTGTDPTASTAASVAAAHRARMAAIDRNRCDLGFNPRAYWQEARTLGVDTYAGGAMATATSTDPVALAAGDPSGGRGSPGLDRLVSATSLAAGGETAAAGLVVALGESSGRDYRAWQRWMATSGAAASGHDHTSSSATAAPDDNGGHGGHAGPQPWVAMTDQGDCVRLARELEVARDTALQHPTAADAMAAGYVRTTPYVPGIAAHYMNFAVVDGEFDVEEPEMLLYDGNGPDAHVVGLSYYLLHAGDAEPTQGFTGPNDHFHRHVGLCTAPGRGVIGDSTTTPEQCAAMGGRKSDGSIGWMNHVWVVPGCESPWGLFSGASPLLERDLGRSSGTAGGGCAGSGVRGRYDLRPGGRLPATTGEQAGG